MRFEELASRQDAFFCTLPEELQQYGRIDPHAHVFTGNKRTHVETLGSVHDLIALVKQIAVEQNADAVILEYDTWCSTSTRSGCNQYGTDRVRRMVAECGSLAAAEAAGLGKRVEAITSSLQTPDKSRGPSQHYERNGAEFAILEREEFAVEGGRMVILWLNGGSCNQRRGHDEAPRAHRSKLPESSSGIPS